MRKFRAIVALFMVIWIQITPWPLGLRPAHAFVALLTKISTGAKIAPKLKLYAPAAATAASTTASATTGNIVANVVQGIGISTPTGMAVWGATVALGIGFEYLKNEVQNNPLAFPSLTLLINQNSSFPLPSTGSIVTDPITGNFYAITGAATTNIMHTSASMDLTAQDGFYAGLGAFLRHVKGELFVYSDGSSTQRWTRYTFPAVLSPGPSNQTPIVSPSGFANSFTWSPQVQQDIERLITALEAIPGALSGVAPLTAAQVAQAYKQAAAEIAQATAIEAQRIADLNPNDPLLQLEAEKSKAESEKAALEAAEAEELLETEGDSSSEPEPEPDIPYNPDALGDPYTLPEVDFGQRLKDFVTAIKGTSIFSLPNSVFGNIPGAGNSQMTINGGQIFGTHIFDFADLSSMWLVLKGIVLTGFSFIAVRIVCLKGGSQ